MTPPVDGEYVIKVLRGVMAACDEIVAEFVSKKRAANWGIINKGLYEAEYLISRLEGLGATLKE